MILYRVVKVSILEGAKWIEKGEQYVKWMPVEADRGNIYADDGNLLTTSLQFFEIRMDPAASSDRDFNQNIDSLSYYLAKLGYRGKSKSEWKSHLKNSRLDWKNHKRKGSRNILIKRNASHKEFKMLKKLPLFNLGQYQGGMIASRTTKRTKPFKDLASRTLGEDRENADKIGLEGYFDQYLTGDTIHKLMKRIPGGIWLPLFDPSEFEPRKGHDIQTTIDIYLQDIVHSELESAVKKYKAKAGTAVLMDVESGAIKAISNLGLDKEGNYREIYNYAIGYLSEPGSTFKLASLMALLEDNKLTLEDEVEVNGGRKRFYDQWMEDSERRNLDKTSLGHAFAISSNVGLATAVHNAYKSNDGAKDFTSRLNTFGLNTKTGIEISGEPSPFIKDPEKNKKEWYGTTLPWMAHGYELMMTPLQILNLYNTVANDGKMMKPYIVEEIRHGSKVTKKFGKRVLKERIASANTIEKAQEMLASAVEIGTGSKLKSEDYKFSGKTGTASINYASKTGEKKSHNASFAGYFPAENPEYSLIVVIYNPKGAYYGSVVAGPVFRGIADKTYALKKEMISPINKAITGVEENDQTLVISSVGTGKGYKKDFEDLFDFLDIDYQKEEGNWGKVSTSELNVNIQKDKILKSKVPDVRGMGLRDALYVLENLGLVVEVHGYGKVKKQTIRPGTKINGQTIEIFLN